MSLGHHVGVDIVDEPIIAHPVEVLTGAPAHNVPGREVGSDRLSEPCGHSHGLCLHATDTGLLLSGLITQGVSHCMPPPSCTETDCTAHPHAGEAGKDIAHSLESDALKTSWALTDITVAPPSLSYLIQRTSRGL